MLRYIFLYILSVSSNQDVHNPEQSITYSIAESYESGLNGFYNDVFSNLTKSRIDGQASNIFGYIYFDLIINDKHEIDSIIVLKSPHPQISEDIQIMKELSSGKWKGRTDKQNNKISYVVRDRLYFK